MNQPTTCGCWETTHGHAESCDGSPALFASMCDDPGHRVGFCADCAQDLEIVPPSSRQ